MADSDSGNKDASSRRRARRGAGEDEPARATGTLEGLLSELIRRSASFGFSGLLVTEEALRRALSDRVPGEWLEFVSRQGDELRRDMLDRLTKEFGQGLRTQEPAALVEGCLSAGVDALLVCREADLRDEILHLLEAESDARLETSLARLKTLKGRFAGSVQVVAEPPYAAHAALARRIESA